MEGIARCFKVHYTVLKLCMGILSYGSTQYTLSMVVLHTDAEDTGVTKKASGVTPLKVTAGKFSHIHIYSIMLPL